MFALLQSDAALNRREFQFRRMTLENALIHNILIYFKNMTAKSKIGLQIFLLKKILNITSELNDKIKAFP